MHFHRYFIIEYMPPVKKLTLMYQFSSLRSLLGTCFGTTFTYGTEEILSKEARV